MKYSITIPAYKHKYLKESIDSILCQSYHDFEIIIINDASPEDIDSIINQYADPRIRYYKNNKNIGILKVVDNWNKCLQYATGEYLICMGDDDKLKSNCLEEYNKLINQYPNLNIYHGWTEIIDEKDKVILIQEPRPERESVYSMIWNRWRGRLQYIGDFLFRTSTLKQVGGFYFLPMAWGSDDISSFIAANKNGIANTQIPVFQYRVNESTITNIGNPEIKITAAIQEKLWYKKFLKIIPNNTIDKIYYNCIVGELNHHFELKIRDLVIEDIRIKGLTKWFYWYRKRYSINLSLSLMIWTLICSIKEIIKHNQKNKIQ